MSNFLWITHYICRMSRRKSAQGPSVCLARNVFIRSMMFTLITDKCFLWTTFLKFYMGLTSLKTIIYIILQKTLPKAKVNPKIPSFNFLIETFFYVLLDFSENTWLKILMYSIYALEGWANFLTRGWQRVLKFVRRAWPGPHLWCFGNSPCKRRKVHRI